MSEHGIEHMMSPAINSRKNYTHTWDLQCMNLIQKGVWQWTSHIIVRRCMKSWSQWFEINGNDGHHTVFYWCMAIPVPILLPTLFKHSSNYILRSSKIHHTTLTLLYQRWLFSSFYYSSSVFVTIVFGPFREATILQWSGAERRHAQVSWCPAKNILFWWHTKACASWTKCSKVGRQH